jgi:hypothetical protein
MLAAPILAHTDMFTMWDVRLPQLQVLQTEKYFKKEKCCEQLVAPYLFGQTSPIQSAGVKGEWKQMFSRWQPN